HSARSSGPAARWIAPSTPPPPSSDSFAALTMASTSSVVMSATRISTSVAPMVAVSSGDAMSRPAGTALETRGRLGRLDNDLARVQRDKPPALLEDAPVDHDGVDVDRLRAAHDRGHRIAERRHVEVGCTHEDQVGAFARRERAGAVGNP